MQPSKSQVDRLGEKLRSQAYGEDELRALDEYRRSFGPAYDRTIEKLKQVLGAPVSGRPAKSTNSIIEKLNRESLRLSQMQDIAGCRIVVADIQRQNGLVQQLEHEFAAATVVDRRLKPSHGYRAVHVIVRTDEKPIEVQVRTSLQHAWAEICEKFADVVDPAIKYGGGPPDVRGTLDAATTLIARIEALEAALTELNSTFGSTELHQMKLEYLTRLTEIIAAVTNGEPEAQ
ncbi:MAG: RelA/SpoT domain-containing protein [Acidobacteria bacterium]|nr:RelA/SpoT domain-containing protein [Acidobacteriota bacterium]